MTRPPFSAFLSALALVAAPAGAASQAMVQPLVTTDADRLAAAMRRLAANPSDLSALIEAGELSLRLGDLSGAASLYARADKVDPRNGRVKAGMASILVRGERPGEALRYFQMAEAAGLAPPAFAADRGLAYDLIGEQERAQRDYRLALKLAPNDETVRRYALSLGISGKREPALELLNPLLQRTDRGAWRARAFVLAMTGDAAEASRIATTMMPAGMGTGLQPFFHLLPLLAPADRAFAVHFGEVRATPERVADARMTPALAVLGPDPDAPRVAVAAARPTAPPDNKRRKRGANDEVRPAPVQVAQRVAPLAPAASAAGQQAPATVLAQTSAAPHAAAGSWPAGGSVAAPFPASVRTASAAPPRAGPIGLSQSSVGQGMAAPVSVASAPVVAPSVAHAVAPLPAPPGATLPQAAPATMAARSPAPAFSPVVVAAARPPVPPVAATLATGAASVASATVASSAAPAVSPVTASVPAPPATMAAARVDAVALVPAAAGVAASTPDVAAAAPSVMRSASSPVGGDVAGRTPVVAAVVPSPGITSVAVPPSVASPPPAARISEDTILARIVANLSIPAAELGVEAPRRPAAQTAVPAADLAEAKAVAREEVAQKDAAVEKLASRGAGERAASVKPERPSRRVLADAKGDTPAPDETPSRKPLPAEKRAGKRQSAADRGVGDQIAAAKTPGDTKDGVSKKTSAAPKTAEKTANKKGAEKTTGNKKAAADKDLADSAATDQKKAVRVNPERIWVQVAGGASADDLPKAWAAAKAKAPEAFTGRSAYTTPLRATHRVLAGPFKTDAEARRFVNQLAKKGVSAFAFTSNTGQVVSKLPSR